MNNDLVVDWVLSRCGDRGLFNDRAGAAKWIETQDRDRLESMMADSKRYSRAVKFEEEILAAELAAEERND